MSENSTEGRVVRHLSATYFEKHTTPDGKSTALVKTARRGQTIPTSRIADGELDRLERLGALMPAGASEQDADSERQAVLDLYRGQRGDAQALTRAMRRAQGQQLADTTSGVVDLTGNTPEATPDASPAPEATVGRLADHITENKLTVDDTVALAENDPEMAWRVLEAEHLASGGSPRQGVEAGLQKIIDA